MNGLKATFLAGLLVAAAAVASSAQTITQFDDPHAGTASGQWTVAVTINTAGTTTGAYIDSSNVGHGFMRTSTGSTPASTCRVLESNSRLARGSTPEM